MKKTMLLLALMMLMPLSLMAQLPWNGQSIAPIHGRGTQNDPYLIENAENLSYLAQSVNNGNRYTGTYFRVTTDLNLNNLEWTPIGKDATHFFEGNFDGGNHIIMGFETYTDTMEYLGLFGVVKSANIRNVIVREAKLYRYSQPRPVYVGCIAGLAENSTISYNQISGWIEGHTNSANTPAYVGGLIGSAVSCTFNHCTSNSNVTGSSTYETYAGGISGMASQCHFSFCCNVNGIMAYANQPQSFTNFYAYAGGITGWLNDSYVDRSYNTEGVTAIASPINANLYGQYSYAYAGGIVGRTTNTVEITNCFNRGYIVSTTPSNYDHGYAGGLSGQDGAFENCYNAGPVGTNPKGHRGGICARHCTGIFNPETGTTPDNNYYLPGDLNNPGSCGDPTPDSVMRNPSFPGILNAGDTSDNRPFFPDIDSLFNDGYPIINGMPIVVTQPPTDTLAHSLNLAGLSSVDPDSAGFYVWEYLNDTIIHYFDANDSAAFHAWADSLDDGTIYLIQSVAWINGSPYLGTIIDCTTLSCSDSAYYHNEILVQNACDTYEWNTSYGTYNYTASVDTIVLGYNQWQCYDTLSLNLTVDFTKTSDQSHVECDSYTWNEGDQRTYTRDTIVSHTFSRDFDNGCDSIITLKLKVNYSDVDYTRADVCDRYTWVNGQTYTRSTYGVERYDTVNPYGCHRDLYLNLTVRNSSTSTDVHQACNSFTWTRNGNTYTTSNNTDTVMLTNVAGCDSTITLNLTVSYPTRGVETVTACDSYNWHGTTYTSSNNTATHFDPASDRNGCDSTTTLNLTINYSTDSTITIDACDHYHWAENSMLYTVSNNLDQVVYTKANSVQCDSTVRLNLTIHYSHAGDNAIVDDHTGPNGECSGFTWRDGVTYTQSTNHAYIYGVDQWGCAQDTVLHLTIKNENNAPVPLVLVSSASNPICDQYDWNGTIYTVSGVYTQALQDQYGCDSTAVLDLTLAYHSNFTQYENHCDRYTWSNGNGNTYNSSARVEDYVIRQKNAAGCDSLVTLDLTVRHATSKSLDPITVCDSYTWTDGNVYTASVNSTPQRYSLRDTLTNKAGCDSIIALSLIVNPSNRIEGDQNECDSYTWHGITYSHSVDSLKWSTDNRYGCDSTRVLHLTIRYSSESVFSTSACDNFVWSGNYGGDGLSYNYTTNTPTHVIRNAAGCDSTIHLNLVIRRSNTGNTMATTCDNYVWNGMTYTTSGTYTNVFTNGNENGCDSTDVLMLTVKRSTTGTDRQVACDSYTWMNGQTYTASNNSDTYVVRNQAGCDSTITLNLTLNTRSHSTETPADVCDVFVWSNGDGRTYYTSTTQTYTFPNANAKGCDSTITLNLVVNYSTASSDTVSNCDTYTWNEKGVTYLSSTTDTMHSINAAGCDHTSTLVLTIRNSNMHRDTIAVCDSLLWNGNWLKTDGRYTHVTRNGNLSACDSTTVLDLTILPSYNQTITAPQSAYCDSYTWLGMEYTQSGSYEHTLRTVNGCDSVLHMDITIYHSSNETINVDASTLTGCDGYFWNGRNYAETGSYTAVYPVYGGVCDSTVTLTLTGTMRRSAESRFDAVACDNDNYTWAGQTYSTTGTNEYTRTFTRQHPDHLGCDSTVTMTLTIYPSYSGINSAATACESYRWIDGNVYTNDTTVSFRLSSIHGCDSVVSLTLAVDHNTSSTSVVNNVCDSYTWSVNNTPYTNSGIYTVTTPLSYGCVHVDSLILTLGHNTRTSTQAATCTDYEWHGNTYTPGVYTYEEPQADGCWFIDTLYLTQLQSYNQNFQQNACDHYIWIDGIDHDQSGTYTVNLFSQDGCDSIVNLHLTVFHNDVVTDQAEACDSYTWRDGITYTASTGDYRPRFTDGSLAADPASASDCPQVYELSLTIFPSYNTMENANVCNGYMWNGHLYDSTGIYTEHLSTHNGCDSTVSLYLIVRYSPHTYFDTFTDYSHNPVFWPETIGQWWDATGVYDWTFPNAAENGCDSISTMNLTVMGKDLPRIISYGNNIIALDHYPHSQNAQGNRVDFAHKRWYHDGRLIEGADDYDYIAKQDFGIMYGTFWCEVTDGDPAGNNWVPSNVIVFSDDSLASSLGQPKVSPNPAKSGSRVRISLDLSEEQLDGALIRIYDLQGRMVMSFEPDQAESLFQNDLREGVYTVTVITKQGNRATTRLVVK